MIKKSTACSVLVILLLSSLVLEAHSIAPNKDAQLLTLRRRVEAKLNELLRTAEFPGATVGFTLPDGRSESVSIGFADLESKVALKPSDRMLAGSIGKTYVAAVTLQLVGEGKVGLDERIDRWLGAEAWFARVPNAREITLRMLMNHTSGIPEHENNHRGQIRS